jgi:UDP-N-acetylglucosamine--N-acetylmuramyl-(pentapeptide) pyrophosphoryl-undecaprenol N-acetylglucosamine transferase
LKRDPSTQDSVCRHDTRGIERKVLAHEGFPLQCIDANPLMGKSLLEILKALVTLPKSLWQSLGILKKQSADLVFGVGGYTSPAMLLAAFLRRIPGVILEPNAYPGMANKAVAPFVQRVFLAFESTVTFFDRCKTSVVGNPVRQAFLDSAGPDAGPGESRTTRHLLIFGGSQGAKAINSAVIEALPLLRAMKEGGLPSPIKPVRRITPESWPRMNRLECPRRSCPFSTTCPRCCEARISWWQGPEP